MVAKQTSIEAFIKKRDELSAMERIVLKGIIKNPNLTDVELTTTLGYKDPNKVRPRRNNLVRKGIVFSTGKRKCRVTGNTSLTWKATNV